MMIALSLTWYGYIEPTLSANLSAEVAAQECLTFMQVPTIAAPHSSRKSYQKPDAACDNESDGTGPNIVNLSFNTRATGGDETSFESINTTLAGEELSFESINTTQSGVLDAETEVMETDRVTTASRTVQGLRSLQALSMARDDRVNMLEQLVQKQRQFIEEHVTSGSPRAHTIGIMAMSGVAGFLTAILAILIAFSL